MTRKVLIDCDPGINDAVALCLALFDERLDVLAITATEGNAPAVQCTRNAQAIVDLLDPPKYPRLGEAIPHDVAPATQIRKFHGSDGLGNAGLQVSRLQHIHYSDKVICDVVRSESESLTIVCLGPLTNIARVIKRDPDICSQIGRLVILGGSLYGVGNETAAAEFNIYFDPESAKTVFDAPVTKTVIPIDVTRAMEFDMGLLEQIPPVESRAGGLLHKILPHYFRAYRQYLGLESIHLHEVVALMFAVHPELFQTRDMYGDVETKGDITVGVTVFDRRKESRRQPNMEVAISVDTVAMNDGILRGLQQSGRCTMPPDAL